MARTHCGMDFGTSNSTFAVAGGNEPPRLLPLEDGKPTIPSAIFFSFEDDLAYFGRRAVSEYVTGADGRLMRSIKSVLGTSLFNDTTRVKREALKFSEILGRFVGELKHRAEANLGHEINQIVCGRPVRFVDDDDAADVEAQHQLESAVTAQGFRHVEFQFEPIAAALDYEQQVTGEELGLVADIGGGTSDFTVIRVSPERARAKDRKADILATAGVHIGGTDFDRLLSLKKVMPLMGYGTETADGKRPLPSAPYYDLATWHRINRLYNAKVMAELRSTQQEAQFPDLVAMLVALVEDRQGHRLAGRVEEAKIALSEAPLTQFRFATRDVRLETTIAVEELDAALAAANEAVARAIGRTLAHAGIGGDRIDTLILTGGSARVPAVASMLRGLFPRARAVETDAFGSVGLGLAIDAARRFG
ncbi:MAG: Hsp70 family protein [Devosia sp.]|uniref:Hsp70 family protein n=1 Tax=Devosia sp. TaxID=1871048 RepID=UPI001ACD4256|nr:Hsp70 family protein [Devosia sp.]MBN9317551.1 Hsp70 family protein [Devosia sp.]